MRFKKLLATAGMIGIIGASLVACEGNEATTTTANGETIEGSIIEYDKDFMDEYGNEFELGNTIDVNGLYITVDNAQYIKPIKEIEAKNKRVLSLDVTATNNTSDTMELSVVEMFLLDKNGESMDSYYGYITQQPQSTVYAGSTTKGKLFFDVPKGDYQLQYSTFSPDVDILWNVRK